LSFLTFEPIIEEAYVYVKARLHGKGLFRAGRRMNRRPGLSMEGTRSGAIFGAFSLQGRITLAVSAHNSLTYIRLR